MCIAVDHGANEHAEMRVKGELWRKALPKMPCPPSGSGLHAVWKRKRALVRLLRVPRHGHRMDAARAGSTEFKESSAPEGRVSG